MYPNEYVECLPLKRIFFREAFSKPVRMIIDVITLGAQQHPSDLRRHTSLDCYLKFPTQITNNKTNAHLEQQTLIYT